ncbi:MAG: Terminase-like family protein [Syntrophorhabdaceae bacterium PtaU1.Bin034]|nr:MAG: Terminase-like family protein [Syntrophorhabdaceae bacterium PtaU1.Bin034]
MIFYGGTRGGGKTDCAIGRHIRGAERYKDHWNGLILRRKFKDFNELRRRIDELIRQGLPAIRIGGDQQTNYIKFENGAKVTMAAVERLEMIDDFQGHQYTEITVEEAPNFPFLYDMIDKLKGCLRSPHGVPCQMFLTGNPGGPAASVVKTMFIDVAPSGKIVRDPATGESQVFIFSSLADNRILCEKDPKYVARLKAIKNPALRRAWLEGDWNVFVGQAFYFTTQYHVIKPMPVPREVQIYMTFDWGFGAPFSIGWWWVDGDGRVYRFAEWYGWDGKTPNQGLRLTDLQIKAGIVARERALKITDRQIIRLANPDVFNKKPDYKGGGQGPSTAETFALPPNSIYLSPGDPSRKLKIRQFRKRLTLHYKDSDLEEAAVLLNLEPMDDAELGHVWRDSNWNVYQESDVVDMASAEGMTLKPLMPMLVVYDICQQFIRTIPSLSIDPVNIEDVDTTQEDHVYDEAALICMSRPIAAPRPEPRPLTMFEKDWMHITGEDPRDAEYANSGMPARGLVWYQDDEKDYEADLNGRWS